MRFVLHFCCLLLLCVTQAVYGQLIHGEVLEIDTRKILAGTEIKNIYNNIGTLADSNGKFTITATSGELVEFRLPGYKIARVRIPHGYIPKWFCIILEKSPVPLSDEMYAGKTEYQRDSIRFREMYGHVLDFPRMSAIEKIKSPFSALSARNREIWQFQDMYEEKEKEKYISYTFNRDLVTRITGLTNDSLTMFMHRFRPTYEQLRQMNDYTFYHYVKTAATRFRSVNRPILSR